MCASESLHPRAHVEFPKQDQRADKIEKVRQGREGERRGCKVEVVSYSQV